MEHQLYIANIPAECAEEELSALFAKHGEVKQLQLTRDANDAAKVWSPGETSTPSLTPPPLPQPLSTTFASFTTLSLAPLPPPLPLPPPPPLSPLPPFSFPTPSPLAPKVLSPPLRSPLLPSPGHRAPTLCESLRGRGRDRRPPRAHVVARIPAPPRRQVRRDTRLRQPSAFKRQRRGRRGGGRRRVAAGIRSAAESRRDAHAGDGSDGGWGPGRLWPPPAGAAGVQAFRRHDPVRDGGGGAAAALCPLWSAARGLHDAREGRAVQGLRVRALCTT